MGIRQRRLVLISGFFWGSIKPVETPSCVGLIHDAVVAQIDHVATYKPVEFQKLLFLSDGGGSWGPLALGEQVAKAYPQKTVVRADLMIHQQKQEGNLTEVQMDNNAKFPPTVTQHKYDFIAMREGMCIHYMGVCTACCGVRYERNEMSTFLGQVADLLNTSNPNAIAVLHSGPGSRFSAKDKAALEQAVSDVQARRPDLVFNYNMVGNKIHSLMIQPKQGQVDLVVP
jgi:hypothetical protein